MRVYGFVRDVQYGDNGTMFVKVRIPSIHGPADRGDYQGHQVRNYVYDNNLPYYRANLIGSVPVIDDVVELQSINEQTTDLIVTGITGGQYGASWTNIGE